MSDPRLSKEVDDYMRDTGANLEEAANELGLNWDEVWNYDED